MPKKSPMPDLPDDLFIRPESANPLGGLFRKAFGTGDSTKDEKSQESLDRTERRESQKKDGRRKLEKKDRKINRRKKAKHGKPGKR